MTELHAVIFDLDDTLYLERWYVLSGFRAVAHWASPFLGKDVVECYEELYHLYVNGVRGNTFNLWLGEQATPERIEEALAVYRNHCPSIAPFPQAIELLTTLKLRYRLGLVSDGYLEVQQKKFAVLNLSPYFDAVVFSDEWGRAAWKPCLKPFKEVLKRLNVDAERAIYIGDNPTKDFLGAKQLGMWTVRIRHIQGEYYDLVAPSPLHTAHYKVNSLGDLKDLLL